MQVVNAHGKHEIATFLLNNHVRGLALYCVPAVLNAWAREAEFSLSEGNAALIEISARNSLQSRAQTYTLTSKGLS
jgi:hypothetical protein